jgi:hypothetical protein
MSIRAMTIGTASADDCLCRVRAVFKELSMRRHTALGLAFGGAALVLSLHTVSAQKEFSSASRQVGRAAVEYRDSDIHIVAAYYHSQRNHDSRWIMLETAVSSGDTITIERSDIALRTPQGREIPLATQRRVGEDVGRIRALLQNGSAVNHDVVGYFVQRQRVEPMNLFTLPFGRVVHDSFVVDNHRVAAGRLFFESPTGAWEDGTYALIVRHEDGTAELPIVLE